MDRKKKILQAIIKHFIHTAEPVGSETILVSYRFNVSPATIRNDMATLEKEGLIFQPHHSAGRIPTDLGYRLFIDEMADYDSARAKAIALLKETRQQYNLQKIKNKQPIIL